jgi:DNA-binding NtrC family response regulator
MGKEVSGLSADAAALLQSYDWPGNVRELQHAVERAVILCSDPVLPASAFDSQRFGLTGGWGPTPSRLAGQIASHNGDPSRAGSGSAGIPEGAIILTSLDLAAAEAVLIARAIEVAQGNRTRAAELLGMSVRTLRNKLNTKPDAVPVE